VISILRASREPALVPVDPGLCGSIHRAASSQRVPIGAGSQRIAKARRVSKDDKSKHWPAETWQNGDLKRFTKDAVEERGCRPVASSARAPIEKIAELTEVPSTSRDTPYELDGLAKPPKQVQRESSRAPRTPENHAKHAAKTSRQKYPSANDKRQRQKRHPDRSADNVTRRFSAQDSSKPRFIK
jgi:hypothetical protein